MKKSLLALAAMGAFVGAAHAQSSVSVYGRLDQGYAAASTTALSTTNAGAKTDVALIGNQGLGANLLGFRGTEDLGGGLAASFVYELGIPAAVSTAAHTVRKNFVQLSNKNIGSLRLGRQETIAKNMNDGFTAFGGGGSYEQGSIGHEVTRGSHLADTAAVAIKPVVDRVSNSVSYASPVFSGFSLDAMMTKSSSDSSATNGQAITSGNDMISGRLSFNQGPISIAIATSTSKSETEAATPVRTQANLNQFGASYTAGPVKGFLLVNSGEYRATEATQYTKVMSADLGVTYNVGKVTLLGSYGSGEIKDGSDNRTKYVGFMTQAHYNFSKRTRAYALYGDTKASDYQEGKSNVYMLGMQHSF